MSKRMIGLPFSLTLDRHMDAGITVRLAGDVDISASPALESALLEAIASGCRHLAIDLSEASILDSTGLTSLLVIQRRMAAVDGVLEIVCANDRIAKVFAITGLNRIFTIVTQNALATVPLVASESPA